MVEHKLKITGLDCMECAKGLEASVAKMDVVEAAELQFFNSTLTVIGPVDEKDLRKLIASLGYGVDDGENIENAPADEPNALLGFWRFILQRVETQMALISAGVVLLSLVFGWLNFPGWLVIGLQIGALILAGWPIARSGVVNLWVNHSFNINFLMTVAGIASAATPVAEPTNSSSMPKPMMIQGQENRISSPGSSWMVRISRPRRTRNRPPTRLDLRLRFTAARRCQGAQRRLPRPNRPPTSLLPIRSPAAPNARSLAQARR